MIPARAHGRCECVGQCGLHRGSRCAEERQGKPARFDRGRLVELEVVYLDGNHENKAPWNLLVLCRQCRVPYECRADIKQRLERQGQAVLDDVAAAGGAR